MAADFVHLRVRTDFSIKTGLMKVPELVNTLNSHNARAVCLADTNNFSGLIKLYKIANDMGVKPMCGVDIQYKDSSGTIHELTLIAINDNGYHNMRKIITNAYFRSHELKKLQHEQRQRKIRVDEDQEITDPIVVLSDFEEFHADVLCLVNSYNGIIGQYVRQNKLPKITAEYQKLKKIFGPHLLQGIARCNRPGEPELEPLIIRTALEHQLPLVATNDVLFAHKDDFLIHQYRVCIAQKQNMSDYEPDFSQEQYLKTPEQMVKLFADLPQAVENTVKVSQLCNLRLRLGHHDLPRFHLDPNKPQDRELQAEFDEYIKAHPEVDQEEWILDKLSRLGLEERLKVLFPDEQEREQRRPVYVERLNYELDVIKEMKFPGYFLIVQEFINWSKDHNIPVGPGRGSGAGSLVAYSLRITDLDPLKYALLFERFLNPARKSMPDFDVDFCNEGRASVIKHIQDHYGKMAVSQIMTFAGLGAKSVVRDIDRVLNQTDRNGTVLAKELKDKIVIVDDETQEKKEFKGDLKNNLELEPQIKRLYNESDTYKEILDTSLKLEGVIRQVGKHAAGIVIAPNEITDYTAMYLDENGEQSSHFDKDDIEAAGLVKFDFLGLKTLTVINNAVKMINIKRQRLGQEPLDISKIPLDDAKSYEILQKGDTWGVFQLEGEGITKLVVSAQPKVFEDIIALIALYRPGPLESGMVADYVLRKNGQAEIFYPSKELTEDCLIPILEPTYGVIIYQEQVMQLAQAYSGYSLGEADNLRRAMGKKKKEEMAKESARFVEGAKAKGIDGSKAQALFDLVEKFAGYGFNKSHSAAYALLSYQTAYLKAHYRAEFLAANLTNTQDDVSKTPSNIKDLSNPLAEVKVNYVNPHINISRQHFFVNEHNEVVFSLAALKSVGEKAIEQLVAEREANGPFKSIKDCIKRTINFLSKNQYKTLNDAGAFDCFIEQSYEEAMRIKEEANGRLNYDPLELVHHRAVYDAIIEPYCKEISQANKNKDDEFEIGLFDMFAEADETVKDDDDILTPDLILGTARWTFDEQCNREFGACNFYINNHPVSKCNAERASIANCKNLLEFETKMKELQKRLDNNEIPDGQRIKEDYDLVLHVSKARLGSFNGRNYVEFNIEDETKNLRLDYATTNEKELKDLLKAFEKTDKGIFRLSLYSYKKKSDEKMYAGRKIAKVRPLYEAVQQCPGELYCMIDVTTPTKHVQYLKLLQKLKPYINNKRDALNNPYSPYIEMPQEEAPELPPQMIYLGFVTSKGIILPQPQSGFKIDFSPELINLIKEECGFNNVAFNLQTTGIFPARRSNFYSKQA